MNLRVRRLSAGLLLTVPLALATYALSAPWIRTQAVAVSPPPAQTAEWYCPMHPDVVSDHEGNCPRCGMALVKNSVGQTVRHGDQFHVTPQVQARMGVAIEPVMTLNFRPSFLVPAEVVADERQAVSISPKVEGWVKRLGVAVVGQPVKKGQMLFEIYSPELQQRQRDYVDILGRRDALQAQAGSMAAVGNKTPDLMMGSVARERFRLRTRLAAADVPEAILQDLERSRRVRDVVPVLAEHDGVVTGIGAREGAYVMPSQTVLSYADLTAVWAELSLTADQLALLQGLGKEDVVLRSPADPQFRATARPDVTAAIVDPVTRLARMRVKLQAANKRFPPGSLLDAWVHAQARQALVIRKDAVIRTGQGDFVIVADDQNHFRQVPVQLGAETPEEYEVMAGLVEHQGVVTNGQFLLSSEASLQATRQRLRQSRREADPTDAAHMEAAAMPTMPAADARPPQHAPH